MDIATIAGIIAGVGVICMAMLSGGSFMQFVDLPSTLIVLGGTCAAVLIRFPLGGVLKALGLGLKIALRNPAGSHRDMVEEIARLGGIARKSGPLGLDNEKVEDDFLAKGIQLIADGHDPEFIGESMARESELKIDRLTQGEKIFRAIGDAAPAFGMIGTLVGLIQMLATMDDPANIGPSMAIALLTTLYGALIANLVAIPVADKLAAKLKDAELNQALVTDGVVQIRQNKNPNLIREMLLAYLPENARGPLKDGQGGAQPAGQPQAA